MQRPYSPSPRSPVRGFWLALVTALCWGVLPLAMALLVRELSPWTITWWRLAGSALLLVAWLGLRGQWPRLAGNPQLRWGWLLFATGGLVGNYVSYSGSLQHITPSVAQTVIQLSPMLLLLAGLRLFGERFSRGQWAGFAILLAGLLLFFNRRLAELATFRGELATGVGLLMLSSILWAGYGVAQKKLLGGLTPLQVLLLLFLGGSALLLPMAEPLQVLEADGLGVALLLFGVANTMIGYGAFAEAMAAWEVSRVSAVVSLAPVVTLGSMALVNHWHPGLLPAEGLNGTSLLGALAVVSGSVTCALSAAPPASAPPPPSSPPTTR